jgi:hypothetical protein
MQPIEGPTPAQWYCRLGGLTLLVVGIVGFFVEPGFAVGERGELIVFDINGTHNLVHLLSGLALLAAAPSAKLAKTFCGVFGVVYGAVAVIGLIDGQDVLGIIPVNAADNVLHIGLSALALIAAGISQRPSGQTYLQSWGREGAPKPR